MAEMHYMPLYVDDYESHTAHLSIEEDGAYSRLLRLCWRTSGCSIPNDPKWIMRRMRATEAQYKEIIKPVIDEFFTIKRGRILQKRQREIFDDVKDLVQTRKKVGKKGGKASALKRKEKSSSKGIDLVEAKSKQNPTIQNQNQSQKLAKASSNTFEKACLLAGIDFDHRPNKRAMEQSDQSIRDWLGKGADADLVLSTIKSVMDRQREANADFAPNTLKYFNSPVLEAIHEQLADSVSPELQQWQVRLSTWEKTGKWLVSNWGPPPGSVGCLVPEHLLPKINGRENEALAGRTG